MVSDRVLREAQRLRLLHWTNEAGSPYDARIDYRLLVTTELNRHVMVKGDERISESDTRPRMMFWMCECVNVWMCRCVDIWRVGGLDAIDDANGNTENTENNDFLCVSM